MSVVYDIGMHNGNDTEYYLKKGFEVVAVEANPALCEAAEKRFSRDIAAKRLTIVNVAIADKSDRVPFYVNTRNSVLSTLDKPKSMDEWTAIEVPTRPFSDIVAGTKDIAFIKVDIEGYDLKLLRDMEFNAIIPPLISSEAHSVDVVCRLICMGYDRFRLVNCAKIGKQQRASRIRTLDGGVIEHTFAEHSSGPFGDDLGGSWVGAEQILYFYLGRNMLYGRGWFDVHAARKS